MPIPYIAVMLKYAVFQGRASRAEYWPYILIHALILISLNVLIENQVPFIIYALLTFIPTLAVTVRRLHDSNISGWFAVIGFLPFIGGLILLVLMLLPPTSGVNNHGEQTW